MKLIVCIDSRGGMSFRGRRVSRDRAVCDRILQLTGDRILMSPYSRPLFPEASQPVVSEEYLRAAKDDDWCFMEREDPELWLEQADKLCLIRWNRAYPNDLKFPLQRLEPDWRLTAAEEFAGHSHKRITMEVYEKCRRNG